MMSMTRNANLRRRLPSLLPLSALLLTFAPQAAAQATDVYLRCVTGPATMIEPTREELPLPQTLLLWVSGEEWREWSGRDRGWSNDLCAPRRSRCALTADSFARDSIVPGESEEVVRLERAIDRRSGAYFQRITTSGNGMLQVLEWEGGCREIERQAEDAPRLPPRD
jgi:hypothetical protein